MQGVGFSPHSAHQGDGSRREPLRRLALRLGQERVVRRRTELFFV